jgi:hypothetical protein
MCAALPNAMETCLSQNSDEAEGIERAIDMAWNIAMEMWVAEPGLVCRNDDDDADNWG